MTEDNLSSENTPSADAAAQPAAGTGHEVPAAFTSPASQPPAPTSPEAAQDAAPQVLAAPDAVSSAPAAPEAASQGFTPPTAAAPAYGTAADGAPAYGNAGTGTPALHNGTPANAYGNAYGAPAGQPYGAPAGQPNGAPAREDTATAQGAAFGIHTAAQPTAAQPGAAHPGAGQPTAGDTQATAPLGDGFAAPTTTKTKKSFGAGKITALIVAAALVGGAAGVGGSYAGNALWAQPISSSSSGSEAITVNNPGSVNETTAIATTVLPSVVTIEVAGSSESGSGSGVVLSSDGYVLTNTHVVTLGGAEADPTIRVTTSDGHIYNAKVVGTDPIYDLAVIQLEGAEDLTPIEFADSDQLNVGSTAVAVGAPLGLANSVTTGIVSALNRSIQIASSALPDSASEDAPTTPDEGEQGESPFQFDLPGTQTQTASESISISVIQTDAAINPGNSGGALVDSEGKLIGINVAIATAGSSEESGSIGVGFAIPSNIAQRVSDEIIENGAATHGLLGATVQDSTAVEDASVAGAAIVEPTSGGAADQAGLKAGDIVTSFNGYPITGATDLTAQVRAAAAGSDAKIAYVRDGETYETTVTLGELDL